MSEDVKALALELVKRDYVLQSVEGPQECAYASMLLQQSFSNYVEETKEEAEF